ncbi:ABC transporter substrate-binding protein [Corynebacterium bovis]|uniref:peptide ABC transporter substrate-binding protein n=1 Tax=Corynebacterium bovis TaxID=36808 RepID=UPI003138AE5D
MPLRPVRTLLAVVAGLSLLLGACSAPDRPDPELISVFTSEPQNPLIPTNTNENGGGVVLSTLFRGLIRYAPDGTPRLAVAESITPNDDATRFDIRLRPGWTFSNGEPVTADSFINAWNYGAAVRNGQAQSTFFESIKGYDDVASEGATSDTMSGLQKVDDLEFTVELSAPESTWPDRLGAPTYSPLPSVAFQDMDAFGQHPVGNGPYMFDSWQHNVDIRVLRNPTYAGDDPARNPGLDFRVYTSLDTAYSDLQSGDLDSVRETVGPRDLASYQADFPDSHSSRPFAAVQYMTVPSTLPHFRPGEEGRLRRQAISLAVDRKLVTDKVFFSSRTPARDFGAPTLSGGVPDLRGADVLDHNPDRARQLWAQADAISPWTGTFEVAYNADGGHKEWVEAVTNSIRQTLGIEAHGKAYPNFKGMRNDIVAGTVDAAFRSGWNADYPSIANFLEPNFATGAASNDGDYTNPEFDRLLTAARSMTDPEEARRTYIRAQEILLRDLPAIPLWYYAASTAWNPALRGFETGWDGTPVFTEITKETD